MTFTTIAMCILAFSSNSMQLTDIQQRAVLQEAQAAYDKGVSLQTADPVASKEAFRRSVDRFNILVSDGIENGKLWYNLGNAQLQSGNIGEAIAAYRLGQHYIPSNGRLAANLQYARSLVAQPTLDKSKKSILKRLAFWHDSLPTQVRVTLGLLLWFGCWSLLCVRFFRLIPGFKTASVTLGCAAIALGISVGADIADQHQHHGVLTANETIVRNGNGLQYSPMRQDPLPEGVEFEIIEARPDWLHIKLPTGSTGWIQKQDAQIVSLDANQGASVVRMPL
ncbi:MAG: hypothetical protein H8E86_01215 [Planctomycetes bacterium]|nr:hypothetical protein [Planctomycetota bacterium]